MAFKEVSSLDAEVTIAIGKRDRKTGKQYPNSAEGYFLGSRTVESKKGESKLHFLQTAKGNLGVWGTTDLNRKLASVPSGTMIRITFTGMQATPNGEMYKYKVEVDGDNTIEVSAASFEDSSSDDDEENQSFDSSSDDDDIQTLASNDSTALANAALKAKVEALLSKRSK